MDPTTWMILLLLLGVCLLIAEVFIPSGGVLGIGATLSLLGAVVFAFRISPTAGTVTLVACLVLVPVVFFQGLRILPRTPFGRLMVLPEKEPRATAPPDQSAHRDTFNRLLGRTGKAVTSLRPAGMIDVGGDRIHVITEGEMIEAGTTVRVSQVDGNRVVVCKYDA